MEFYLGIVILILSLALLLRAVVNRRLGDTPYCRKCKFELTGLTDPDRCPECGRELSHPRAIRIGKSRVRARPMWWGLALTFLGGAFVGIDAMNRSGFIDLTSVKPAGLLFTEAYLLDNTRASAATIEIEDRAIAGKLGPDWQDRILATALARHAQTWRSFPDAQWMFITDGIERGELSGQRTAQLFDDAGGKLRINSVGRRGQAAYPGEWIEVIADIQWRAGTARRQSRGPYQEGMSVVFASDIRPVGTRTKIGMLNGTRSAGRIEDADRSNPMLAAMLLPSTYLNDVAPRFMVPENLPPGEYRAKLVVEVSDVRMDMLVAKEEFLFSEKPIEQHTKTLTATFSFTVAEAGSLDPKPVTPADLGRTSEPDKLVGFKLQSIYKQNESVVAEYNIDWSSRLKSDIGIAGVLIFSQDGKAIQGAPFCKTKDPDASNRLFGDNGHFRVELDGFHPGIVNVRYESYSGIASNNRHRMGRYLQGPIQLEPFEIPENPPDRKPESMFGQ